MQLLSTPVCSVPYKAEPYLMLYLALFKTKDGLVSTWDGPLLDAINDLWNPA